MIKHIRDSIYLLGMLFLANNVYAQTNDIDLYDLSIGDLAKIKVVTASKVEQVVAEVPATIRVITSSEIAERGYFTIDELLSDLPGFQFRDIKGINSYIFQRGLPNQNNLMLLLIDGIQVNKLNSGGFYGGGQYNMAAIERVEVVYGPSSVTYGTNAVSGVVNIITKHATDNSANIGALGGSFYTLRSSASVSHINLAKKFDIRFSAMGLTTDKSYLRGAVGDGNWTDLLDNFENNYSFGLKLNAGNVSFGSNYMQKQTSTSTSQKTVGTPYSDFGTLWNIRFINHFLKYEKQISEKIFLSTTLFNRDATVLKNTVYSVLDTTQVGYSRPNNQTGIEGVVNYKPRNNLSVTGGALFEYEQLADGPSLTYSHSSTVKPPLPEKPSIHNNFLVSTFIEPRLTILQHLNLSGGLRFDQSSVYNQVVTPQLGLNYRLKKHYFHASYAEAFRAPKPWDYSDGTGNPDLLPEKMNSFEVAGIIALTDHVKFDITGYKNELINGIVREFEGLDYRWVNHSAIHTNGIEMYLSYSSNKIKAISNYTLTNSKDETGKPIAEISKHGANASITWLFYKNFKMNIRANYMGKRENPRMIAATNSTTIDPYLVFNGALTWNPYPNIAFQLIGKNLLNAQYYHSSNRTPDRYRQPPGGIFLSLSYQPDL